MIRLLLILMFTLFPYEAYSQPEIYFDSEKHNFGRVESLTLEHIFEFINKGDKDLIIDRLVPS